jgi:hypothetical protein
MRPFCVSAQNDCGKIILYLVSIRKLLKKNNSFRFGKKWIFVLASVVFLISTII